MGGSGETILHDYPRSPRLLDPANPANNLFDTGFTTTQAKDEYCEEKEDWAELKRKIETIDLTVSIQSINFMY